MELYRELKSLYIIVGIGYAALGSIAGIKKWNDTPYSQPIFWSSLFCIWLLHGYTLHKTILQNDIIQLNVATSVSLLVALAIAIYTICVKTDVPLLAYYTHPVGLICCTPLHMVTVPSAHYRRIILGTHSLVDWTTKHRNTLCSHNPSRMAYALE
jgi:ABC-type uncharacterized transport system permease subunit